MNQDQTTSCSRGRDDQEIVFDGKKEQEGQRASWHAIVQRYIKREVQRIPRKGEPRGHILADLIANCLWEVIQAGEQCGRASRTKKRGN